MNLSTDVRFSYGAGGTDIGPYSGRCDVQATGQSVQWWRSARPPQEKSAKDRAKNKSIDMEFEISSGSCLS